jgi:hypothetical protein
MKEIKYLIRQLVREEMVETNQWIVDCTHIVLGPSPWRGDPKFLGQVFPFHVTGISINGGKIYAAVSLFEGPQGHILKPYIVVATQSGRDVHPYQDIPMWGNRKELFLAGMRGTLLDKGQVTCLFLHEDSINTLVQSICNLGYNLCP